MYQLSLKTQCCKIFDKTISKIINLRDKYNYLLKIDYIYEKYTKILIRNY